VPLETRAGSAPIAVLYIVGGSSLSIVGRQRICDELLARRTVELPGKERITGCIWINVLRRLSSETQIELSVDLMSESSYERQYKENEERVTQKKVHAGERWLRVVLHIEDVAEGEFKRHP